MNPHIKEILDKIQIKSPEECEKADFVLCLESKPENEARRTKGSIDVACDGGCGTMVMLSSSSPVKPPKLCMKCAVARLESQQSFSE
jgi:hypothetical protein